MISTIVLDSSPLGLIVQKRGITPADKCRIWIESHIKSGVRVIVPEIIRYECRRELLRIAKVDAIRLLDQFINAEIGRLLPITSADLTLAAQLWADSRKRGMPTADVHALDIDVILAAQVLNSGLDMKTTIVATSNLKHLSQFVPAEQWDQIV